MAMTFEVHLTKTLPDMRILQMFNATARLPEKLKTLFELLFVKGMNEQQVSIYLNTDIESISRDKSTLIRSLKAVAS